MGNLLRKPKGGLEEMPMEVLNKIAEEAGFVSIQRLRAVSRRLHKFVTEIKPHYFMQKIAISLKRDSIKLILTEANTSFTITFSKYHLGTTKVTVEGRSMAKLTNYFDTFFTFLNDVLGRQKSIIEEFEIKMMKNVNIFQAINPEFESMNSKFVAELQKTIHEKTWRNKLRTKQVRVYGHQQNLLDVLALLDADCLKAIEFFVLNVGGRNCSEELIGLEQWNAAEELSAYIAPRGQGIGVRRELLPLRGIPIIKLTHFIRLSGYFGTVTTKELDFLRKTYAENSKFESAEILARTLIRVKPRDPIEHARWRRLRNAEHFYKTKSPDHVVGHFFGRDRSHFRRIPLTEVPQNVEIEDLP
ncbi:hypothetical protein CAEBREN_11465 [Caenorhabditis brenneri]|uniref:F-box domain-containing protein n=1 Tax=Caenorhabditis brenneri TaxID=135651 RepID=G0MR07_CAEBE|nr:hypothetical protein CAEBREN_11465 [Caenorhabditis brenneri]